MQTAINPALAAAMTLEQAAQVGEFSPVTKDGTPTVVGGKLQQMMQPMMPQGMPGMQPSMPGLQNAAQQAGLGAQIQAMQMKEAQSAMMNQAMQQARGPAGIEGLNPQMGNFAEGGIVGYAEAGVAEDEQQSFISPEFGGSVLSSEIDQEVLAEEARRVRQKQALKEFEQERARNMARVAMEDYTRGDIRFPNQKAPVSPPPAAPVAPRPMAAPSAPSGPTGLEALFEKERAGYRGMKGPASLEQSIQRAQQNKAILESMYRAEGIDPNYIDKRLEEDRALTERQRSLLRERMEREQGRDTFLSRAGAALRGFSQMKGQGIGGGLAAAHENLARQVQSGEIRMDQMRDFEIRLNELDINRRRALEDAKRATVEGRAKDAQQELNNATAFSNDIEKMVASTFGKQAAQMVEERKASEAGASRMADQRRIQELYQLRLNTLTGGKPPNDEQKMEAMEYALQAVKGAAGIARKPSPQETRQRMLEQYADNWEKMDLLEKNRLREQGIGTYENYVKYRDRIAGVAPTGGGSASGQILKFDKNGNLIQQ